MTKLLEEFESQLKNLNKGVSFMDKEAILFHEINLQLKIFTLFTIIGLMMVVLGVVI